MLYSQINNANHVAGFKDIYEYHLFVDQRMQALKDLEGHGRARKELEDGIYAAQPGFKHIKHGMREYALEKWHRAFGYHYAHDHYSVYLDYLRSIRQHPPRIPAETALKKTKEKDLVVSVLDFSSALLSFVGLDIVPEAIGFVYSEVKGDDAGKVKYLAGILMVGPSGLMKNLSWARMKAFVRSTVAVSKKWLKFSASHQSSVTLLPHDLSRLKEVQWKENDGILDLIIHGEGNAYHALVENNQRQLTEVVLSEKSLAEVVEKLLLESGKPNQPIRLLSCSNLESAQKLSTYLNRPVIATDGVVHLHPDGGITTVARSGNSSQKWYQSEGGNKVEVSAPRQPEARYKDDLVVMGLGSQTRLQNLAQKIRNTFPNTKVGYFENELAKVPNIEYILNDANAVARIMTLDNTIAKYSLGSGSGAVLFTERQAFLYDLQSVIKKDKYGGSLRKLVEGKQTDLPTDLIKNWQTMSNTPTVRRRADYLLCSADELAEKLVVNYANKNLDDILKLAPNCKNCYNFYKDNGKIRVNIWNDVIQMYTRLGKGNSKTDWGQFFASFEAHHILPKDLLVPDKKNPRAINGFIKYMEHYQGKVIDFNTLENGIMLEKFSTTLGLNGVHASHNEYTRHIRSFFDKKYDDYLQQLQGQFSGKQLEQKIANEIHGEATKLVSELKKLLETKSINGRVKVNDLVKDNDFLNLLK